MKKKSLKMTQPKIRLSVLRLPYTKTVLANQTKCM